MRIESSAVHHQITMVGVLAPKPKIYFAAHCTFIFVLRALIPISWAAAVIPRIWFRHGKRRRLRCWIRKRRDFLRDLWP